MNTSEIETLLEKFYEGNTSLQEERELREFFLHQDVPVHLKSHQPVFAYFEGERKQEISSREPARNFTGLAGGKPVDGVPHQIHSFRQRFLYFSSIAASFIAVAGLLFIFQRDVFQRAAMQRGTLDTEIAYTNATEALMMVSGNLNHGLREVEHLQMVDKAMKNMELFNKFYQYQTIIINPDELSNRSTK